MSSKTNETTQTMQDGSDEHITICALMSENRRLRKSTKDLRMKLIKNNKQHLFFKINQMKKYHELLSTNRKIRREHEKMKKCLEKTHSKNKELQQHIDNILDVNVKAVADTCEIDKKQFSESDLIGNQELSVTEINEIYKQTHEIENEPKQSVDVEPITSSDKSSPPKTVTTPHKRKRVENKPVRRRKSSRKTRKMNHS